MKRIVFGVVLAAPLLLISACASLRPSSPFQVAISEPKPLPTMNGVAVSVTLSNSGRRPSKRLTVACDYVDATGSAVQTGLIYFNNVPAGGSDTHGQMVMSPTVVRGDCALR